MQGRLLCIEAFHRCAKTVLKIQPAHLAVADYVQTGSFLQADRALDCLVLDRVEFTPAPLAFIKARASLLERGRPQQTADHISSDFFEVIHSSSSPPGEARTLHQLRKLMQARRKQMTAANVLATKSRRATHRTWAVRPIIGRRGGGSVPVVSGAGVGTLRCGGVDGACPCAEGEAPVSG